MTVTLKESLFSNIDPVWVHGFKRAMLESNPVDLELDWDSARPVPDVLDTPSQCFVSPNIDFQRRVEWLIWTDENTIQLIDAPSSDHVSVDIVDRVTEWGGVSLLTRASLRCVKNNAHHIHHSTGVRRAVRITRGARRINGTMVGVKLEAYCGMVDKHPPTRKALLLVDAA